MSFNRALAPSVTQVRNICQLAGISLPADLTNDTVQLHIDASVEDFQHRTGRQFIPGCADEVRYFDGSGTGELIVDAYVSITDVEILTVPAIPVQALLSFYQQSTYGKPKTRIGIQQGPANYPNFWNAFPQGRGNIKVTGTWGYASEVPHEVYLAMMKGAAADLAAMLVLRTRDDSYVPGRLLSWQEADVSERYADSLPGEALGWKQAYDDAIQSHMKPRRRRVVPLR
jgi:hypothetical protein